MQVHVLQLAVLLLLVLQAVRGFLVHLAALLLLLLLPLNHQQRLKQQDSMPLLH